MVQIPASSAGTSQNLNRVWAGLMYQVGQLDFTCDLLLGGCYKRIQWPRGRDSSVITVFMGRPAYFFPATKACRKANHSFYGQLLLMEIPVVAVPTTWISSLHRNPTGMVPSYLRCFRLDQCNNYNTRL